MRYVGKVDAAHLEIPPHPLVELHVNLSVGRGVIQAQDQS
jgi:hypothetical protein